MHFLEDSDTATILRHVRDGKFSFETYKNLYTRRTETSPVQEWQLIEDLLKNQQSQQPKTDEEILKETIEEAKKETDERLRQEAEKNKPIVYYYDLTSTSKAKESYGKTFLKSMETTFNQIQFKAINTEVCQDKQSFEYPTFIFLMDSPKTNAIIDSCRTNPIWVHSSKSVKFVVLGDPKKKEKDIIYVPNSQSLGDEEVRQLQDYIEMFYGDVITKLEKGWIKVNPGGNFCWFDALMMIFFFSEKMKKFFIDNAVTKWSNQSRYEYFINLLQIQTNKSTKSESTTQIMKKLGIKLDENTTTFPIFDFIDKLSLKKEIAIGYYNSQTSNLYAEASSLNTAKILLLCVDYPINFSSSTANLDGVEIRILGRLEKVPDEEITIQQRTYRLDAFKYSNFQKTDQCDLSGTAIAGITIRGKRYLYNTWCQRKKNDSRPPCAVKEFDWLRLGGMIAFCVDNDQLKAATSKTPQDQCFLLNKGARIYFYVLKQ